MNNLDNKRHSLAHLLAAAVTTLYPDAKPSIGPFTSNGFYYDFEFSSPISDKDLAAIEKKMRAIQPKWDTFDRTEVSTDEARKQFAGNEYKLELIGDIEKSGEPITLYTSGEFTDLCRGGHVEHMKEIPSDSYKLERIAGAYWRGDEKNKMLTRIYGLAFETKEALDAHITQQAEAEKRDHRKLGKELDLFVFSDVVGKGLPLWTERGATVRRELERFIVDEEIRRGYRHVYTPDIAKIDLYKKSGHYPYYKDSMYAPITIDDDEFMLRPMTCPHHFELYLSKPHSYKDLPMRIAEMAKLYRYEQSGELTGLIRVRSFCLADAHIICRDSAQAATEVNGALDLIEYICNTFGLKLGTDYWYRLSLGDRADDKKYFKDDASWDEAESKLREVLTARNAHFVEAPQEAAFYGPKIDIQMKDVRGKDNTAFTVQYDFVMPGRFNLTYVDSDGKDKQAIVIHRSSIGAIERIVAFLIEHFSGNFPLWLSPTQVSVIPVSDAHVEAAQKLGNTLKNSNIRVDIRDDKDSLGKKIRAAKQEKTPYWIVVGDKEIESGTYSLEHRSGTKSEAMSVGNVAESLIKEITEKQIR
ncbi:MAG TPA: threonine--tRNA ligase [Candidatus Paceibacterota bacterium]|nr:threonine--tRNA ligase [Candidatus Paceibacterota bacterium]